MANSTSATFLRVVGSELIQKYLGDGPKLVRELFVLIASLRGRGVSILLVEQNVHQSLKIADRAYVLEKGSIALSGTGPELIGNDFVRAAFLGLDQPGSSVSVPR